MSVGKQGDVQFSLRSLFLTQTSFLFSLSSVVARFFLALDVDFLMDNRITNAAQNLSFYTYF